MRFSLFNLLALTTIIGLGVALFQTYGSLTQKEQESEQLKQELGLDNMFRLQAIAGEDITVASAWLLRIEEWESHSLEFRIHGTQGSVAPYRFDQPIESIDTFLSHNYTKPTEERHFMVNGKDLYAVNGLPGFSVKEKSGFRVAVMSFGGERRSQHSPILYLMLGDQEAINSSFLNLYKLSPRNSETIQKLCIENGFSCVTLRIKPIDEDPDKPSW